jgi:hypothetical protein
VEHPKRLHPLSLLVVSNDGFAKANPIEIKQELVLEHAQKMVKNDELDGPARDGKNRPMRSRGGWANS